MKPSHPFPSLLVLALIASCQTSEPQHNDRSHVTNAPELTAEEELRVGSVDDPDMGFSRIGGVAVGGDGTMYVLESQDREIRVYDTQGNLIRRIGGDGAGPGEFRNPVLIGLQRDTLAVADLSLARMTLFHPTGELIETLHMPPIWLEPTPGVHVMVAPVAFTPNGYASSVVRMMMPPEPPRDSFPVPHVALDRKGQITDTIRYDRWNLFQTRVRSGNVTVSVPTGPSAATLYIDGPEHTYVVDRPVATTADRGEFTVTRIAAAGDTIYRVQFGYQPLTFGSDLMDSIVVRAVRPHLRDPDADSGAIEATIRQALVLPPYQPPIAQGRVGADGVLWLRLSDSATDRHRWILIDSDGQLAGTVLLPREATIQWSSGDLAVAVMHDEFDVPWLVRYRIHEVSPS